MPIAPSSPATPACPTPTAPRPTSSRAALAHAAGRARLGRRRARRPRPGCEAVRDKPAPFWAMESLLREYPISSAEGLALMRLAEALLRVPDAETAIALTADQLGRADFDAAGATARTGCWPACRPARSRCRRSSCPTPTARAACCKRLGASTVVAATVRAVQLLGRQFVLGQTIGEAMERGRSSARARAQPHAALQLRHAGRGRAHRADARALPAQLRATRSTRSPRGQARRRRPRRQRRHLDQAQRAVLALRGRAARARDAPSCCRACGRCASCAADANLNLTIDAEESRPARAVARRVRGAGRAASRPTYPQWRGFGLAVQAYQTRALEVVDARRRDRAPPQAALHVPAGQGRLLGRRDQARAGAAACRATRCSRTSTTPTSRYLACARALLGRAGRRSTRSSRRTTPAPSPRSCRWRARTDARVRDAAPARHGRGRLPRGDEGRADAPCASTRRSASTATCWPTWCAGCWRTAPTRPSCTSWPTTSVGMDELLASPLQLDRARRRCRCRPTSTAPRACAAQQHAASTWPSIADARAAADAPSPPPRCRRCREADRRATSTPRWRGCDARLRRLEPDARSPSAPPSCAAPPTRSRRACRASARLLVKEAHKTWGDCVAEVREAVDFLRYYADEAERVMQPHGAARPDRREQRAAPARRAASWVCISPWNFPLAIFAGQVAAALVAGNTVPPSRPSRRRPSRARWSTLLHEAGVPADALALLHGPGETVGAALVADAAHRRRRASPARRRSRKIIHRALAAQGRPDRAADRRDRRHQRDARRLHARCPSRWSTRSCRAPSARPASAARRCACCACTRASPTA